MTDLGTLGGNHSIATGINNAGQVIGQSYIAGASELHAFLYSGGSMFDLGTLGGEFSQGRGINDAGQAAGFSENSDGDMRAFFWNGTTMQDLGTLGGFESSAYSINSSGHVAGWAEIACGTPPVFDEGGFVRVPEVRAGGNEKRAAAHRRVEQLELEDLLWRRTANERLKRLANQIFRDGLGGVKRARRLANPGARLQRDDRRGAPGSRRSQSFDFRNVVEQCFIHRSKLLYSKIAIEDPLAAFAISSPAS